VTAAVSGLLTTAGTSMFGPFSLPASAGRPQSHPRSIHPLEKRSMWNRILPRGSLLIFAAMLAARVSQAQTGRVTGQVTDSASARPITGVQIVAMDGGQHWLTILSR
jgi:hypothetical protein